MIAASSHSRIEPANLQPAEHRGVATRLKQFWRRITDGLSQLWNPFRIDTRTSYRLYSRDIDWLVVFTDGVVDAINETDTEYGEERLGGRRLVHRAHRVCPLRGSDSGAPCRVPCARGKTRPSELVATVASVVGRVAMTTDDSLRMASNFEDIGGYRDHETSAIDGPAAPRHWQIALT